MSSRFEFDGWTCRFDERKNAHVFQRDRNRILVRHGDGRRLTVQRSWWDRTTNAHPTPYGNVNDGGEQGGQGIVLYPKWERGNREAMDGTIERHAIGWPMPPEGKRYALDGSGSPYKRIDGPHYIRAYRHAVAEFAKTRDPVARMDLILCAGEVMRRFPLSPFTDGEGPEYSLYAMTINVFATPHYGALGICRELAWCLRAVVEAQRVAPSVVFALWIMKFIDMLYMGQSEHGWVERHDRSTGLQQGEPWGMFGLAPEVEVCTSWQVPFLVVAVHEAMKVVPTTYAHGRVILERFRKLWNVPYVAGEDGSQPGLPRYLVVGEGPVTRGFGPARPYYDIAAFACFVDVGISIDQGGAAISGVGGVR